MADQTPRRRLFEDNDPAAPASPASPLKPRPSARQLNPADQNRVHQALELITDVIAKSNSTEKTDVLIWELMNFVTSIAQHLGRPSPINLDLVRQTAVIPGPSQRTRSHAGDGFIVNDGGRIPDDVRRQMNELGIPHNPPVGDVPLARAGIQALEQAQAVQAEPLIPLTVVTFAPNAFLSVRSVTQQIQSFVDELASRDILVKQNRLGAPQRVRFTPNECRALANIVFETMLGKPGVDHVHRLIMQYRQCTESGATVASADRATLLSQDFTIPPKFRALFLAYAQHVKGAMVHSHAKLTQLNDTIAELNMANRYDELIALAGQRDPELVAFLTEKGYVGGRGVTMAAGVKKYVVEALAIQTDTLNWILNHIAPVQGMIDLFGAGILVFLQRSDIRRIHDMGNQRLETALRILKEECPWIEELCGLAQLRVLDPIKRHQPLTLQFRTAPALTWHSRFAVEEV